MLWNEILLCIVFQIKIFLVFKSAWIEQQTKEIIRIECQTPLLADAPLCLFSECWNWYTAWNAFAGVLMSINFKRPQHLTHEGIGFIAFIVAILVFHFIEKCGLESAKINYGNGVGNINYWNSGMCVCVCRCVCGARVSRNKVKCIWVAITCIGLNN